MSTNILTALRGKFKPIIGKNPRLDNNGHEILSDKPMAIPVGFRRPPTLAEQVARLVRTERFKESLEHEDLETFEEADDFDIPDDPLDPTTPYEADYDHAAISAMDKGIVSAPTASKTLAQVDEEIKAQKASNKSKASPEPKNDPQAAPAAPSSSE